MKTLSEIGTVVSMQPQMSEFHAPHRHSRQSLHLPHDPYEPSRPKSPQKQALDISNLVPPFTKSEQQMRIAKWTQSVSKNLDVTENDHEATTSLLVDEGVRHLLDWDLEVKMKNPFAHMEITSPHPPHRVNYEKDVTVNTGLSGKSEAAKRLNLIADLKKIKQSVDPEDAITPRIIVKEFEKFMDAKRANSLSGRSGPGMHKRVQFIQAPYQDPPTRGHTPVESKRNPVLLNTPTVGVDLGPAKKEKREVKVPFTTHTSPRSQQGSTGPSSSYGTAPQQLQPKPNNKDPDWWRRKIRRGLFQTEDLMGQLSQQRKDDEKYIGGVGPSYYPPAVGPKPFDVYQRMGRGNSSARGIRTERQRLQESMERMRKQHELCFGSCPAPNNLDNAVPNMTSELQQPYLRSRTKSSKMLGNSFASSTIKRSENIQTSRVEFDSNSKPPTTRGGRGREEITVLFDRRTTTGPPTSTGGPLDRGLIKIHDTPSDLSKSSSQYAKQGKGQNPTPTGPEPSKHKVSLGGSGGSISGSVAGPSSGPGTSLPPPPPPPAEKQSAAEKHKKFMVGIDQPKLTRKEWMSDLVEAKIKKEVKELQSQKLEKEKQKAATNALYHELLMNKQRIKDEVDREKMKMEVNWRFHGRNPATWNKDGHYFLGMERDKSPPKSKKEKKEILQYPQWKEPPPKGLSMWLENVMEKAKEKKRQNQDDAIIPLAQYHKPI